MIHDLFSSPFFEVGILILKTLPHVMFNPSLAWIFWLVMGLIAFQYRRAAALERNLYGVVKNPVWERTLSAAAFGILGGLFGSFIFVFLGTVLSRDDIAFVWPLALLLMAINPRFICFSYAGGLVALSSLTFGWPAVNVPGLIALVAILHLVEGLLVAVSGDDCATPVYVAKGRNQVVGGFALQRFWPIPVVILLMLTIPEGLAGGGVEMPDWWPLIPPSGSIAEDAIFTLFPVVAALGYSDIVLTCPPAKKSVRTARYLVVYGGLLLGASLLATRFGIFSWIAAAFSALGHEVMAQLGSRGELNGKPFYVDPEVGVRILDVLPKSPAETLGLKSGDVVLQINGRRIESRSELRQALSDSSFFLEITVQSGDRTRTVECRRNVPSLESLGLILVPGESQHGHVKLGGGGILGSWLSRVFRRHPGDPGASS